MSEFLRYDGDESGNSVSDWRRSSCSPRKMAWVVESIGDLVVDIWVVAE